MTNNITDTISAYESAAGITITRNTQAIAYATGIETLIQQLDQQRGAIYSSNFEFPGRYTCWDMGFVNPAIVITAVAQTFRIEALNQRGKIILKLLIQPLQALTAITDLTITDMQLSGTIIKSTEKVAEEYRSKQNSIFSVLRAIITTFKHDDEPHLGLYGAFGYDLVFQFEDLQQQLQRSDDQRDLVLYLPDELYIVDHRKQTANIIQYDFSFEELSTEGLQRDGLTEDYQVTAQPTQDCDHSPGEYADIVRKAKQKFKCGDLFEVVPGQMFFAACEENPSVIFKRLRKANPAPYGFFINLGEQEYLVGASPEMYTRVHDQRVETAPISGTIKRGKTPIEDADNILTLLNSKKDESELTMCTDVDRNDKSRICEPGSVKVIGRRHIEMYSRLIHTVDHVEGIMREEYDAIDAFLTHMWVVTVTGAPKLWAMQFIEENEKSARRWYAGAVGRMTFDGNMNTGLTLRTIRIKQGIAEVRAGATLLYDSDPDAEEAETRLKASAFLASLKQQKMTDEATTTQKKIGAGKNILLIDHQDSFVHTLANYLRQTGATVTTLRYDAINGDTLAETNPHLVVLSPGPGCPQDFNLNKTIDMLINKDLPIFGVCLGLQGLIEYFGGELQELSYPVHGKPSAITITETSQLFKDLNTPLTVGRYHSLHTTTAKVPAVFNTTAYTDDDIVMAIEHKTLPISAVQFHPESILSMGDNQGMVIIKNMMAYYT